MEKPFAAYRGEAPYVFVCYAHADAAVVYPELQRIRASGINVYYDEGIAPGHEWTQELADAIDGCQQFLFYVSPESVASRHCRNEVQYALDRALRVVSVYLQETDLPGGLKLALGPAQAIQKFDLNAADYGRKLDNALAVSASANSFIAQSPDRKDFPRYGFFIFSLSFVVLLAAVFWWREGKQTTDTIAVHETQAVTALASIAVMPFSNLSDAPGQEYFSEGVAEEILNALVQRSELSVISRSSAFALKEADLGIPAIGQRLGADHVLEGSVRRSGDRIRIVVRLIDAASDRAEWSKTYERSIDDIFKIQNEIAESVAQNLGASLKEVEGDTLPQNLEAHTLLLQARYLMNRLDPVHFEEIDRLLTKALALEPDYQEALSEHIRLVLNETQSGLRPWRPGLLLCRERIGQLKGAVRRAAWESYLSMLYPIDLRSAARNLEYALGRVPNNHDVLRTATLLWVALGQPDRAIGFGEKLVRLDPLCGACAQTLGIAYLSAGRTREAASSFSTFLTLSPETGFRAYWNLGTARLLEGAYEQALEAYEREPNPMFRLQGSSMALFSLGRLAEFEASLNALRVQVAEPSLSKVFTYAWTGRTEEAFAELFAMIPDEEPFYALRIRSPLLRKLHADPRWKQVLARTGQTEEYRVDRAGVDTCFNPRGEKDTQPVRADPRQTHSRSSTPCSRNRTG